MLANKLIWFFMHSDKKCEKYREMIALLKKPLGFIVIILGIGKAITCKSNELNRSRIGTIHYNIITEIGLSQVKLMPQLPPTESK